MYVGTQYFGTSSHEMEFLTRHGVTHFDAMVDGFDAETLARHREEASEHGVELEMVHIPWQESIGLAQDPERDHDIDNVCTWIENAAKAGLRGLNYNFLVLLASDIGGGGVQRTARTKGRGGSTYSSFVLEDYDNDRRFAAGEVSREACFERAAYFLERIIPVAEENKIQMACHLNDPPTQVLNGVEKWNWPVLDGLKRFSELVDSDYHGFNFCCGVASEGLENPGKELPPIVEYFAKRKKIFNVHFRNIRGGLNDFSETWPDEGDVNMHEIVQVLHKAGYEYMLMPDHAPHHPDDVAPDGVTSRVRQAWAFQFGYIIALIQAVENAAKEKS
ncbi:MAG: mannonate dehydratase [Candidatus Latescibacterota bacterium]|nr:mannonate dehydratase [Candidatus Latescibacterota bacterium]